MKHVYALLIKFIMVAAILEIMLLLFSDLTFGDILWLSVVVTIVAYVLGDLFILSISNNTIATIADIGLTLVTILVFNLFWVGRGVSFLSALVTSAVLGLGEIFFHKYISNKVLD
jgi:hypothetical protein